MRGSDDPNIKKETLSYPPVNMWTLRQRFEGGQYYNEVHNNIETYWKISNDKMKKPRPVKLSEYPHNSRIKTPLTICQGSKHAWGLVSLTQGESDSVFHSMTGQTAGLFIFINTHTKAVHIMYVHALTDHCPNFQHSVIKVNELLFTVHKAHEADVCRQGIGCDKKTCFKISSRL